MTLTTPKKLKKVVTTVRIDPMIKSWAQSYAHAHGTDLSTLINMQLFETRKKESFRDAPYMSNE
jgi:antitoxin component of RelBE/YafQ-DinJ toxin-antitoxin module